ncbi:PAS domain S-box protein [Cohnella herbarum]|uniref:PAS domain S-box protein n=1 Tax=Cohnella herbarum TaxID=2728023 RepID=A0A7Z2ZLX5_9BACL|nr:PAS domain S-box protein [Cohnella herbarum]QJD84756.1 PAS domain S-box protein [Cohnella herbarum]
MNNLEIRRLTYIYIVAALTCQMSVDYLVMDWSAGDWREIGTRLSASVVTVLSVSFTFTSFAMLKMDKLRQSEAAEREKQTEEIRTTVDLIKDGYYETDEEGRIVFFNAALCEILGVARIDLLGKPYTKFIPINGSEWEVIMPDGTKKIVENSIARIRAMEDEGPEGFRGIIRNKRLPL